MAPLYKEWSIQKQEHSVETEFNLVISKLLSQCTIECYSPIARIRHFEESLDLEII